MMLRFRYPVTIRAEFVFMNKLKHEDMGLPRLGDRLEV